MSKRRLSPELDILEQQLIETMQAGLREYRPDLSYPESYSDMQACVRGLLKMFEIKRSPLPRELSYHVNPVCECGHNMIEHSSNITTPLNGCSKCHCTEFRTND